MKGASSFFSNIELGECITGDVADCKMRISDVFMSEMLHKNNHI